jgi:hypothetical protein
MRKTKNILSALAVMLLFAGMAPSCKSGGSKTEGSGEQVELKLNFKPGDKYLYSTQVSQKINSMGMTGMDQSMLMEMVYELTGADGNNKMLTVTYSHIQMKNTTPMGVMEYNSKEGSKKDAGMGFMDSLIGKSFSLSIAPNGDIVKVEGLDNLVKSITGMDKSVKAEVENQFSDTAIKLMMQNSFDIYPGKPVKVGDTWSKKSIMGFSGFNIAVENSYALKSVSGGKATISVTSVMTLPKSDMGETSGAPMKMEMDGKQEGTMDIDIATGQIISGKTQQTITGKLSAAGQVMPMDIKGDITISSKKL